MRAYVAVLLVGCAQGHSFEQQPMDADDGASSGGRVDAEGPRPDGKPDAHVMPDAHVPDAYIPPDAFVPKDAPAAMPDAHVPDAYVCTVKTRQLLLNPVVDLAPAATNWVQQNIDNNYPIVTSDGFAAQSAPYKAWMAGFIAPAGQSLTDMLYQDVAIPANTSMLVLTGYYAIGTEETGSTPYDTAQVGLTQTNGTPIETAIALSNANAVGTWTAFSKTFTSNLSGQTVRLRFTTTADDSYNTNFFFDTFALTATYCE